MRVLPRPRISRRSVIVCGAWSAAVAGTLLAALDSLSKSDFDGLNNIFQLPFALPWFLLPIGGIWSHEVDAWVAAGMGWLNAALLLLYLDVWLDRGARRRASG